MAGWLLLAGQIALEIVRLFGKWYVNRLEQAKTIRQKALDLQRKTADRAKAKLQRAKDEQSAKDYLRNRAIEIAFRERGVRKVPPSGV